MAKKKRAKTSFNWSFFLLLPLTLLIVGIIGINWSQRSFCANSISCKESFNLKVENGTNGVFDGQKVVTPVVDLSQKEPNFRVLGEATATGQKHIYVDLSKQILTAYQGNTLFMQTFISSGKWHPTPTGDFTIWEKIRATRMSGGEGADFYDLPNVPYVMFFSGPGAPAGAGFSLHGAYWHDNFGHAMSHGCVNMRIIDAQRLYDWADPPTNGNTTLSSSDNPGTIITIYGQPPI